VPARFLTDERLATYGRYAAGPPDQAVLDYVAAQLGVADPSCMKRYTERDKTRLEHQRDR
jgi:hypothetical protein